MVEQTKTGKTGLFSLLLVLGMIAGGIFGSIAGKEIAVVKLLGDLFMNALKMIVIPLIVSSMVVSVTSLGDPRKLGRLGGITIVYYMITTLMAVVVGIILVNLIHPGTTGTGREVEEILAGKTTVLDVIRRLIPGNIFKALAEGEVLPLIFVSIFFGTMLSTMGEKARVVVTLFEQIFSVTMRMVHVIVKTAPVGVFALVATSLGKAGGWSAFSEELRSLGMYVVTVLFGLLIHAGITLPLILFFLGRKTLLRFLKGIFDALATAFSTASSSATLPVTMECIEDKLGGDPRVGNLVLPLGATINMDGTALYEAVAAVFIAQSYNVDLSFADQVVVVLTATLAAIGAAGIPHAGLVTMILVLNSVGLPTEGIGMILAVDWFLDRCRTTVNVMGDAVGAITVERFSALSAPGTDN